MNTKQTNVRYTAICDNLRPCTGVLKRDGDVVAKVKTRRFHSGGTIMLADPNATKYSFTVKSASSRAPPSVRVFTADDSSNEGEAQTQVQGEGAKRVVARAESRRTRSKAVQIRLVLDDQAFVLVPTATGSPHYAVYRVSAAASETEIDADANAQSSNVGDVRRRASSLECVGLLRLSDVSVRKDTYELTFSSETPQLLPLLCVLLVKAFRQHEAASGAIALRLPLVALIPAVGAVVC